MKTWTDEQNELLRHLWPTGESLKPYLAQFGDRPYNTVISHAHKVLGLGSRPKSARGVPGYAWEMIKAELKKSAGTAPELIQRTGLTTAPVCALIKKANPGPKGEIHIIDWRKRVPTGGAPVAIYAIGPGKNAPKPEPYTTSEKWQRKVRRRKAKADPFAAAAGLVQPPSMPTGRVYHHLWDDHERRAA
jgi:hypothetical protein